MNAFAQTAFARVLADALVGAGVREVVVSPGSRSTPFVLAFAAHPSLRLVDVIDERSAAFVALGHARATGEPAALLCTSGTAPAHWYPAILEASISELPLVCISADRPFDLQHAGASQTLDQTRLFGEHVRFFADLGGPDPRIAALRGLRRTVLQAVALSRGGRAGPVHLNARAFKPLEPGPAVSDAERALSSEVDALLEEPSTQWRPARATPDGEAIRELARLLRGASRPWIVAGPLPREAHAARDALHRLAEQSGAALATEMTSQLRCARPEGVLALDAYDLAVRDPARLAEIGPDLVIQLGTWPVSSAWDRFVSAHPALPRVVLGASRWIDPAGSARLLIEGDLRVCLDALSAELAREPSASDQAWRARVARFESGAWRAVEERLSSEREGSLGEGAVARALAESLPERGLLMIGNSLPVRTLDRFVPGHACDVDVLSQRGAAGIDGLVSGALGAARAAARPSALLLGDVSMRHDLSGLSSAHLAADVPLAIVAVDNGGGRIFEQLPVARRDDLRGALSHFTTPGSLDLSHAAALFGVRFASVARDAELRAALRAALGAPGVTLIQAHVPAQGALEAEREILARMELS